MPADVVFSRHTYTVPIKLNDPTWYASLRGVSGSVIIIICNKIIKVNNKKRFSAIYTNIFVCGNSIRTSAWRRSRRGRMPSFCLFSALYFPLSFGKKFYKIFEKSIDILKYVCYSYPVVTMSDRNAEVSELADEQD